MPDAPLVTCPLPLQPASGAVNLEIWNLGTQRPDEPGNNGQPALELAPSASQPTRSGGLQALEACRKGSGAGEGAQPPGITQPQPLLLQGDPGSRWPGQGPGDPAKRLIPGSRGRSSRMQAGNLGPSFPHQALRGRAPSLFVQGPQQPTPAAPIPLFTQPRAARGTKRSVPEPDEGLPPARRAKATVSKAQAPKPHTAPTSAARAAPAARAAAAAAAQLHSAGPLDAEEGEPGSPAVCESRKLTPKLKLSCKFMKETFADGETYPKDMLVRVSIAGQLQVGP